MSRTDSYRHGLSLGAEYADADRAGHFSFASGEAELREEARIAGGVPPEHSTWRAFKLGVVRGYRSATRTLERGRWGL